MFVYRIRKPKRKPPTADNLAKAALLGGSDHEEEAKDIASQEALFVGSLAVVFDDQTSLVWPFGKIEPLEVQARTSSETMPSDHSPPKKAFSFCEADEKAEEAKGPEEECKMSPSESLNRGAHTEILLQTKVKAEADSASEPMCDTCQDKAAHISSANVKALRAEIEELKRTIVKLT